MKAIVIIEIVCAVFLSILLVIELIGKDKTKHSKFLNISTALVLLLMIIDAMAYSFLDNSTPFAFRYVICLFAYIGGGMCSLGFAHYSESIFKERTNIKPWTFLILKIALTAWIIAMAIAFFMGKVVVYESKVEVADNGMPLILNILLMAIMLYTPILAIIYRKQIGKEAVILLSLFSFSPIVGMITEMIFSYDFTYIVCAFNLIFVAEFLQRKQSEKRRIELEKERFANEAKELEHKTLEENYARFFALEDNFESLYDVDMITGTYEVYVKGDFYRNNVLNKLTQASNYFEDLRNNIESVIYNEDKEGVYAALNKEAIIKSLEKADHFDYFYRIETTNGPVWFKMRVVYKDKTKSHAIIGVFIAENDEEVKQLVEQKAQIQESLTFTNFFLDTYVSAYYVNLLDLSCQVYKRTKELERKFPILGNYYESLKEYIEKDVHPDDQKELLELVSPERMRKVLKEKVEYSHIFRDMSDGIEKTYRMQIIRGADKNTAAFGFIDISKEVNEQASRLKEAEESNKLIASIAANYNVAYAVNVVDDSFRLLRMDDSIIGKGEEFNTFSEAIAFFVSILPNSDKERMSNELKYETIKQKLANATSYDIEYRVPIKGAMIWHEMNVTKIDENHVAIGFAKKDLEITQKHLEDKRYNEYFALYEIDIESKMMKVVKDSPWYGIDTTKTAMDYSLAMQKFANTLDEPAREFFMKLSNLEYIKELFKTEDKYTYAYRSNNVNNKSWVECTSYVTLRNKDGSPAMFTFGFSLMDSLGVSRQEMQRQLNEDMQMIGGLASGYYALYYCNFLEGFFKIYSLDGKKLPKAASIVDKGGNPVEIFMRFSRSDLIHPEDRQLFTDLTIDKLREKLGHSRKFTIRFRRNFNGEYHWAEMDVIKYGNIDDEPNDIALGFAERDYEIRSEQALNNSFDVLGQELPPEEAINRLLLIAGEFYGAERCYIFEYQKNNNIMNNTYEWCAQGIEPMIHLLQNIPLKEVVGWNNEFKRHGAFYMDALDSEHNTKEGIEILAMQGIQSIVAAPLYVGDEIIGFIGVDNPTKAKTNINVLKKTATVIFSEILKRKENDEEHVTLGKLADTFLSVYYADLSTDYMRTWKIDKNYQEAYGSNKVKNYSVSMGGYVRSNIAERDRERCIEMTSPEYVLEQFKSKDRFSIEMTDIMLGYERNIIFDYIKVNEDGSELVLCCRDVTETLEKEKEQQRMLNEARIIAEAANQSKTNFLFSMSHDIRTPMNAITGFTNMAIKHIDEKDKVLDYLDKTQKAGTMLLSLINSVLEVSRIEAGNITIEEQYGDVYYSFANVESTLQELAKTKDIKLSFEFGTVTNQYVYADFNRCMRIFVNVISNAIKYTPEGGTVKVKCEQNGEAKNNVVYYKYTVSDNGIGMSEEFQKHVFDQFARENTATVSGIPGSGLGMSVVKSFVDLLGGTIEFESKQGVGTTFTIILPFKLQVEENYTDPETGEVESKKEKKTALKKVNFKGKKVLLVEDNDLNREIAIEILEEEKLIVDEANDGTVALDIIKEKGPDYYDFILMDIQMPIMNGYEATKEIREMYPDAKLPIIALSANAFAEDKAASLAAGMNDHVSKPINTHELFNCLKKYL